MISVMELMSDEVKTLPAGARLAEIYTLMREKHIRHVPIVDAAGTLLGIVSYLDVMAATPSKFDEEPRREVVYSHTRAGDIMKTGVKTVSSSTSAREAATPMEKLKIDCLPIVDDQKLVGIITDSDFLGVAINLMEQFDEQEAEDSLLDTEL